MAALEATIAMMTEVEVNKVAAASKAVTVAARVAEEPVVVKPAAGHADSLSK